MRYWTNLGQHSSHDNLPFLCISTVCTVGFDKEITVLLLSLFGKGPTPSDSTILDAFAVKFVSSNLPRIYELFPPLHHPRSDVEQ